MEKALNTASDIFSLLSEHQYKKLCNHIQTLLEAETDYSEIKIFYHDHVFSNEVFIVVKDNESGSTCLHYFYMDQVDKGNQEYLYYHIPLDVLKNLPSECITKLYG